MDAQTRRRLFGIEAALDHPVTLGIVLGVAILLVLAPPLTIALHRRGRIDDRSRGELMSRIRSWWALAPLMLGPVLLGAFWFIATIGMLGLLCHREFARATGLFRHRALSATVAIGIAAVTFATLDHWYGFFVAIPPLTIGILAAIALLPDDPRGYIQRVSLGVFAFLFFGAGLGHLGYFANDLNYRPILLLLIAAVELNDVFAYLCGKTFGRRKLCPRTSPNKTVGGALGALALTTALVAWLGRSVFASTPLDDPILLIGLGLIISVGGQLGDLMLSSIKRDLGIKDMGVAIPGHGGLLDRFDSLLLVAPAAFHYINYFNGVGLESAQRIISG